MALCGSAVIMIVVLYLAHGFSLRTTTALLGTLAGLLLVGGARRPGRAQAAHLTGVTTEDALPAGRAARATTGAPRLRGVFLCGVVLAGLGVLNDVTITQASAVWELRRPTPDASRRRLFTRACASAATTSPRPSTRSRSRTPARRCRCCCCCEIYGLPLGQTLTSGQFAEEIVRTLVGSIGLVLAIPLTTAIAAIVTASRRRWTLSGPAHAHCDVSLGRSPRRRPPAPRRGSPQRTTDAAMTVVIGMASTRPIEPTSVRTTSSAISPLVSVPSRRGRRAHQEQQRQGRAHVRERDRVDRRGDVVTADPHAAREQLAPARVRRPPRAAPTPRTPG